MCLGILGRIVTIGDSVSKLLIVLGNSTEVGVP
jgi:hypothetical protein